MLFAGLLSSALFCFANPINSALARTAPQVVTLASPMNLNQAIQQLALTLVNRDRTAAGLPPMRLDAQMSQVAQTHAEDMLRRNYFSHYSPEGRGPNERLAAVGVVGYPAENIVMDEDSRFNRPNILVLEDFQSRWMQSERHRRNLMNPNYQKFGYGFALNPRNGRTFAVQMFSRP